jgi:methionyl-tRNA synthetase
MQIKKRKTPDRGVSRAVSGQQLYPWGNVITPPFECGWYTIAPSQISTSHNHYECESFFIVQGTGRMTVGADTSTVETGDTIFLPPFSQHQLRNLSDDTPLDYLAVWWEGDLSFPARGPRAISRGATPSDLVIVASRPTPNSDLHLGHLAGPYVAADVLARSMRMRAVRAHLICGTDDHQTYVALRALRAGSTPRSVVSENSVKIARALEAAQINPDCFVKSSQSNPHIAFTREFFGALYSKGMLEERAVSTLYCQTCERYAVEGLASGLCGHCGSKTYADVCEACVMPNFGVGLHEPRCSACAQPLVSRETRRLVFPLESFRAEVEAFLTQVQAGDRLRQLARNVLQSELAEVPVTLPTDWGIEVPISGYETQRISPWLEVAAAFLSNGSELFNRLSGNPDSDKFRWNADAEIVQFFGVDNGFFYAIFYPALLAASGKSACWPRALVMNNFYRLNDSKFSSGRAHALWAGDILQRFPADIIRFYLMLTRPEEEETTFSEQEFHDIVGRELGESWNGWLVSVGQRASAQWAGIAPSPEGWTTVHRLFFRQLADSITSIGHDLSTTSFSPQRALGKICQMVQCGIRFGAWAEVEAGRTGASAATTMVLELAAVKTLAGAIYPIMPEFGHNLWRALGLHGEPTWPDLGSLIAAGNDVSRLQQPFFSLDCWATNDGGAAAPVVAVAAHAAG